MVSGRCSYYSSIVPDAAQEISISVLTFSAKQMLHNRFILGVCSFVVIVPEGQTVDDVDKLIEEWKVETGYHEFRKASKFDVEIDPKFKIPSNWSMWSYDNKENPANLLTGVDGNISLAGFMLKHGFGYTLVKRGQHMFSKNFL